MSKLFIVLSSVLVSYLLLINSATANAILASQLIKPETIGQVKVSPDGSRISALLDDEASRRLSLYHTESKTFKTLVKLNRDVFLKDYFWADNNRLVLDFQARQRHSGLRSNRYGLIDIDFGNLTELQDIKWLSPDGFIINHMGGEVIFARQTSSQDNSYDIHKISLTDLFNNEAYWLNRHTKGLDNAFYYSYSFAHNNLFGLTAGDKNTTQVWIFNNTSKKWESVFQWDNLDFDLQPLALIKNTLFALSNEITDKLSVVEIDLSNSKTKVILQKDNIDLESALINESGKLEYISYYSRGLLKEEHYGKLEKEIHRSISEKINNREFVISSISYKKSHWIVFAYNSDDPGAYYLYNTDSENLQLIDLVYPDLNRSDFSGTELLEIDIDGVIIEGYLTRPKHISNGVLLVNPHGGPIGVRDYKTFNTNNQLLASRGYSVLKVNFRGSSGYGKKFKESGIGQFGKIIEQDISATVDYVLNKYHYDKVCSIGYSYGGYSAVILTVKKPKLYDCAIAMYGIYDIPLLFNTSNLKLHPDYIQAVKNTVGKNSPELLKQSPVYLADQIDTPILLIAGKKDSIADIEQTNRLKYTLKKHGKNTEYVYYNKVGHGQNTWYGDRHQLAYIDNFLRRTLDIGHQHKQYLENIYLEENIILAKSYEIRNFIETSNDISSEMYEESARSGDIDAALEIGSRYITGNKVDKDIDAGVFWLNKASNSGSKDASFKLAKLYADQSYSGHSQKQAFTYFIKADNQGHDARAGLYMAKYLCIGLGVSQDINRCLNILSQPTYQSITKKSKDIDALKYFLGNIFLNTNFRPEHSKNLSNILEKRYGAITNSLSVKRVSEIKDNKSSITYKLAKKLDTAPPVKLSVNIMINSTNKLKKNALLCKWVKLEGIDETVISEQFHITKKNSISSSIPSKKIDRNTDMLRLEIYDLNLNLLQSKSFKPIKSILPQVKLGN